MKVFKIVRLSIWSLLLAACSVIALTYVSVQQSLLSTEGLKKVTSESNIPSTIRNDLLTPKIYAATQQSELSQFIDEKSVATIVESSASDQVLSQKLSPAFASFEEWINGKRTDTDFTVDITDLVTTISGKLVDTATKSYATLPACTIRDTQLDARNGTCRSPLIPESSFRQTAEREVAAALEAIDTTVTQDSIPYFSGITAPAASVPRYLNIFYAISMVAISIVGLVTLWLLLKHRLVGIITIGSALLLSALTLLIITVITPRFTTSLPQSIPRSVSTIGINAINQSLQQKAIYAASAGSIALATGSIIKLIIMRRKNHQSTMHFSDN